MQYVIGTDKEQFAAIKNAAKIELAGIKLIIKRRKSGAVDIYPRVSADLKSNKWSVEDTAKLFSFIVNHGLVIFNGSTPTASQYCYEGLYYKF